MLLYVMCMMIVKVLYSICMATYSKTLETKHFFDIKSIQQYFKLVFIYLFILLLCIPCNGST